MKVLCQRLPGPIDGSVLEASPWLTLDAVYTVASVTAEPGGRVQLQVVADDGHSLAWFNSDTFMTVDSTIPERWVARIGESGSFDLGPAAWLEPGFWEAYYDGDPAVQRAVEDELRQLGV
jgi:hypothetical protein